ncbi:ras-related protein rab-24 [Anaeramoeba flamelloides]|uniref:Ras-related protein rab-24 n=1 Tax=Anaeramoeba flamelloides TaxID=1746091 RepID=A0AAV7Y996_9EUKA|nr:ras-related protein rab-24 [Anaeramoeba flamelloides]KAJ6250509.1 ras-related protein rab-24 [Anaeramoeba flamelloides]
MNQPQTDIKVVLLGSPYVGKTCLVERFINKRFNEDQRQTIGGCFSTQQMTVGNDEILLGIWDTAGQERYEAMTKMYYRGAHAAIICYDVTDKTTFERLRFWIQQLQEAEKNCSLFITATKIDLLTNEKQRAVSLNEVENFSKSVDGIIMETSAKYGQGIDILFDSIAKDFVRKNPEWKTNKSTNLPEKINLDGNPNKKKKCC